MQSSERKGKGGERAARAVVGSHVPHFGCLQPPSRAPKRAQGLTGLTTLPTRGRLGDLLGTGDVQSPILETEAEEKEEADTLLFPCKWRAGRQP